MLHKEEVKPSYDEYYGDYNGDVPSNTDATNQGGAGEVGAVKGELSNGVNVLPVWSLLCVIIFPILVFM